MPFCYLNETFLNPLKNNRQEKIVIFTSEVQIKKLEKAARVFIDATFRCSPKEYYQLFNILADIGEGNIIFPIFHVLMTNKSSYSYSVIFNNLNNIINKMKINFSFNNCHIMTDFEHGLRETIKEFYPDCILEGCFFHYSKSLWNKSKKLGLISKKYINNTRFINSAFKIYPFLKTEDKIIFLNQSKIQLKK